MSFNPGSIRSFIFRGWHFDPAAARLTLRYGFDVGIEFDETSGLVREFKLTLTSVDYLNNSEWSKRAIDLAVEIEAFLEAMEGAATSGPEL